MHIVKIGRKDEVFKEFHFKYQSIYSKIHKAFLGEPESLKRRLRSFQRGTITIVNDLDEFVRVSVQVRIRLKYWDPI